MIYAPSVWVVVNCSRVFSSPFPLFFVVESTFRESPGRHGGYWEVERGWFEFGTKNMESVSKYAVSSYTPTLSALISARPKISKASRIQVSHWRLLCPINLQQKDTQIFQTGKGACPGRESDPSISIITDRKRASHIIECKQDHRRSRGISYSTWRVTAIRIVPIL